ncbi:hypothetical protein D5S18_29430 [Nocardia panacis]|uniref:Uncharacterized protein n=1 Tax=Nocardia panacis TaxID=2340916 RepID=A0A3A4K9Y1_9NOCA|nr:hypothetical protein [Nocardia panacis]RJO69993.1 hypothetical protein D5S18_29430 [Nocardia panacis]
MVEIVAATHGDILQEHPARAILDESRPNANGALRAVTTTRGADSRRVAGFVLGWAVGVLVGWAAGWVWETAVCR